MHKIFSLHKSAQLLRLIVKQANINKVMELMFVQSSLNRIYLYAYVPVMSYIKKIREEIKLEIAKW